MKRNVFLMGLLLVAGTIQAQVKLDSIFTNEKVIACNVMEITPDAVKFAYPEEDLMNTIYKNTIQKIVFRSGRVEEFAEATSYKTVRGGFDWQNVSVTKIESEVRGLFKLDDVSSKAKGTTTLSNMNKVKDRAMKKLKIEAAMLGGNIIFMTDQNTVGNIYGTEYQSGRPTETNLSGIAYSNKRPDFKEFKQMIQKNQVFRFAEKYYLGNNNVDMKKDEPGINFVRIDKVENEQGFIVVYSKIAGEKTNQFRVAYFNDKEVVLCYRDKRKIYNLVLKQ